MEKINAFSMLLSWVAFGFSMYSLRMSWRARKAAENAHQHAADAMVRSFGIEVAARRALARWEGDPRHLDTILGGDEHADLAEAMEQLRAELIAPVRRS